MKTIMEWQSGAVLQPSRILSNRFAKLYSRMKIVIERTHCFSNLETVPDFLALLHGRVYRVASWNAGFSSLSIFALLQRRKTCMYTSQQNQHGGCQLFMEVNSAAWKCPYPCFCVKCPYFFMYRIKASGFPTWNLHNQQLQLQRLPMAESMTGVFSANCWNEQLCIAVNISCFACSLTVLSDVLARFSVLQ